ncbi:MAG: sialidase family protein [Flavitalea sp.]
MKKLIILFWAICLNYILSCNETPPVVEITSSGAFQVDSIPGTAPFLTKDHKGNVVLSWVRNLPDSTSIFCYAISFDGGNTFSKPIPIPSSKKIHAHSENLPKVIFKPSGEILAIWGVSNPNPHNKYSGLVNYSQSFDDGNSWSEAKPLVKDTAGYDQRYSDVALLSNGEVAIIWLDNRVTTAKDGAALYFSSTNGGNGFQGEKLISQPCCECCRTDLFVDSKSNIHVLFRGIIQDSIRDMVHAVSSDGGKNFSDPKQINDDHWVLNGCPHTGPAMAENEAGLHFAWFTGGGKTGSFYTRTIDNGKNFTGYDHISHVGRHPQLASFSKGELIIVWDESIQYLKQSNKRIGIQLRSPVGETINTKFITADSLFSSYPVVSTINKNSALVGYCKKQGEENYIMYQRVVLDSKHG